MVQEFQRPSGALAQRIQTLSAREQLEILWRTLGPLRQRERAAILGNTGLNLFRYRGIRLILDFLLKFLLRGVIWSIMFGAIIVACIFLLALLASYPAAANSLVAGLVAYCAGFLVFNVVDFFSDILPFIRTTIPKAERAQVVQQLNALEQQERVRILQALGASVFKHHSGDSIIASLVAGVALCVAGITVIVAIIVVSRTLPGQMGTAGFLPPLLWAIIAFLCGYFVPSRVQRRMNEVMSRTKIPI